MKKLVNWLYSLRLITTLPCKIHFSCAFVFLFFCLAQVQAKNYYVSSSIGNDTYSATQAQSISTPWKSLSKVNSIFSTLLPGDSVLFKRGDLFFGTLIAAASGNATNRIVIGAYGTGAKPILTGFVKLTGWTNLGGGIWQTTASSFKTTLNLVTLNNKPQPIGRYPNVDAANGGYLNYEAFNGTVSITDNELPALPNWTGADVVIRKTRWILDVCSISNHSGTTLTYANPAASSFTGKINFGYFIQNDPKTLDQLGEWFFNKSTKVLQMFFGANDPVNYALNASAVDTVLNLGSRSYITVDNIAVEGSNAYGVLSKDGSNVTIQNCSISNSNDCGIYVWNVPNVLIENNSIVESLSNGIYVYNKLVLNSVVRGNNVRNVGRLAGMGESGDETYNGVWISGDSVIAEYNNIDTIGYVGLNYKGSNGVLKNNFINHFCSVKDDGGGIYIQGGSVPSAYKNRKITGNIITNAIGAPYGTQRALISEDARGIYLDLAAMNVEVSGNSISNCIGSGLYFSNSTNIIVSKNTVFNSKNAISFQRFPGLAQVRNNVVKGNIFFPLDQSQPNFFYWNGELNNPVVTDIQTDMRAISTFDSNYYRNDVLAPFDYYYHLTNNGTFIDPISLNLPQWKSFINADVNSKAVVNKVPAYKIDGTLATNNILNGKFETNILNTTVASSNNNHLMSWDNSSKITGVGSLKIAPISSASTYTVVSASAGAITAGKNYLLKFSTLGTTVNGFFKVSFRQTLTPYATLFKYQFGYFGNTIQQNEFLFTATVTEPNVTYLIEIMQSSGTVYIDNIELTEVKASMLNPASQVRFDYNPTKTNKSVTLDAPYFDVLGSRYTGSIVLAPYTSMVLIKDTIAATPLVASSSATVINCNGGSSTVTVSATGGTSPYTGTGSFVVTAGTYTYTVRDAAGSTSTTSITVSQPIALVVSATAPAITVNGGTTTVTVSATGGTSPYTGTGNFVVTAGTYTYTVRDASGATSTTTITVGQPTALVVSAAAPSITVNGGTTTVTVSATGGTSPYTGTGSFVVTAGTYNYTVTDAKGCSAVKSITITQPTALVASSSATAINCNGGSSTVTVSATGGTSPYTGTGSFVVTAGTYTYTVRDAAGATSATTITVGQPTALVVSATAPAITVNGGTTTVTVSATGGTSPYTGTGSFVVSAGTYNYTVTDAKGCSAVKSITITQPAALVASSSATAINCNGGSSTVTVSATGGTTPYRGTGSFVVTAGTYTYTVQDAAGATSTTSITIIQPTALVVNATAPAITVNGGTTAVTVSATGGTSPYTGTGSFVVTAGTYNYTVTDAKGCSAVKSITITQPAALVASSSATAINCNGGSSSVTVSATGGTSPYTGTGSFVVTAGTYNYTVRDAAGATSTTSITVSQPTALVVSATAPAITLNGGTTTVTVSATGGTSPYTGTGSFVVIAGTYTYTVTDAKGCSASQLITVTQPAALMATTSGGLIPCFNGSGVVTVSASGGSSPYTGTGNYAVSAGKGSLRISFNSPVANNYTLNYWTIGAVSSQKRYVLRFSTLGTTSTGTVRVSLRQTASPLANLTPYQFANFGTTRVDHSFIFSNATAMTDASFIIGINQSSGTTYIDNIAFFEVNTAGGIISNNLYGSGNFESNISGIWTWSPTNNHISQWDTTRKINQTYYFRVLDAVGNSSTAIFNSSQSLSTLVASSIAPPITVAGGSTTVTVSASGGTAPYTGVGNFLVTAGTYTFKVTDALGCTTATTITIAPIATLAKAVIGNTPLLRMTVFPNPAEREFNLSVKGEGAPSFEYLLMSVDGKIVSKGHGNLNAITRFGNNLAQGLYILRLMHKGKTYNARLVKGG